MNLLNSNHKQFLSEITKYLMIAISIVILEMGFFIFLNSYLKIHYTIVVILSFIFATILNWYACKKFVFKKSKYSPQKEILLTLIANLIGVTIQLGITILSVEILHLLPAIGKFLSLGFTFIWNFVFRKLFIYK